MKAFRNFSQLVALCALAGFFLPVLAGPSVPDDRDRQVLEAMLSHLLDDPEFNMTRVASTDATIVLNVRAPKKTGMIRPEQIAQDTSERHSIPRDAQADLLRRNEKTGTYDSQLPSFADVKFGRKVLITNLTSILDGDKFGQSFEQAYPTAKAWVEAWLPGYSNDGTKAVIRAWIGPSSHGAIITAVFERRDGKWCVDWCYLTQYV